MAKQPIPSPEELRQLLRYDPNTGKMFWIGGRGMPTGKEAFTADDGHGYRQGRIKGRNIQAHRIAWALAYGRWPDVEIDHINRNKADNRLINLREATPSENGRNKPAQSNNVSGYKGVSWRSSKRRWRAQIALNGRNLHLGYFNTAEEAHSAYSDAARKIHGEFARTE